MNNNKICQLIHEKRKIFLIIFLGLIVVFAFWLRFRLLGVKDMWIDEYFTEEGAFYTLKGLWLKGHTRTSLFFSFIMKCYASTLSFFYHKNYLTPFELRLPNVVFGTLLTILVFFAVRKASDLFTAFLASIICATTPYFVFYSRDGRYYPLMLVCVAICFLAVFNILSVPFDDKKQYKYHIAYMLAGFCGMFTHYGFWIFFATSNIALCTLLCYRFFAEESKDNFIKKCGKILFQFFSMALPAFLVPLIVYNRGKTSIDGTGVSLVFSDKLYDKTYLLNVLSYDSLNVFFQDFCGDFKLFTAYGLLIIAIVSLLLLVIYKHKKAVLYLVIIRFGMFALLRFIPKNVVHESLRPRYIIFVLLIDIILISLLTGAILKYIQKALSIINTRVSKATNLILIIAVFLAVTCYSTEKVFRSKLKIYNPSNTCSEVTKKIKEIYEDGDVVLTDVMDVFYAFPYYKKIDKQLENIKCYFIGWIDRISTRNTRIFLLTKKQVNSFPNLQFIGSCSGLYLSRYIIPDDIYDDDLAFILSKIINTNVRQAKPTLDKWSRIKSNVLEYVFSSHQENNIITNSDFFEGLNCWNVNKQGNVDISLITTNDYNAVKISGKGDWSTFSQKISVKKGRSYKFIIDLKCDDWSEDLSLVFGASNIDKSINYINFPRIEITNCWSKTIKILESNNDGEASVRIQYKNKSDKGSVFIRQIKAIELRDKRAKNHI